MRHKSCINQVCQLKSRLIRTGQAMSTPVSSTSIRLPPMYSMSSHEKARVEVITYVLVAWSSLLQYHYQGHLTKLSKFLHDLYYSRRLLYLRYCYPCRLIVVPHISVRTTFVQYLIALDTRLLICGPNAPKDKQLSTKVPIMSDLHGLS
jgi:hypothetical protein